MKRKNILSIAAVSMMIMTTPAFAACPNTLSGNWAGESVTISNLAQQSSDTRSIGTLDVMNSLLFTASFTNTVAPNNSLFQSIYNTTKTFYVATFTGVNQKIGGSGSIFRSDTSSFTVYYTYYANSTGPLTAPYWTTTGTGQGATPQSYTYPTTCYLYAWLNQPSASNSPATPPNLVGVVTNNGSEIIINQIYRTSGSLSTDQVSIVRAYAKKQ